MTDHPLARYVDPVPFELAVLWEVDPRGAWREADGRWRDRPETTASHRWAFRRMRLGTGDPLWRRAWISRRYPADSPVEHDPVLAHLRERSPLP